MKGFYGFAHKLLAAPVRFVFNIRVVGRENEPKPFEGAFLMCANHLSAGDPVWLCAALHHYQPHFMAKAELFKIPLLNSLIRLLGAYPIERGGADVSGVRNTINLLKSGRCVGMFPQGTRQKCKDPQKTAVKSGVGMIAVRSEVQVLPIFIHTKGFKPTLFGRKTIVIGSPIPYQKIAEMHEEHMEYRAISQYIFDQICDLNVLLN